MAVIGGGVIGLASAAALARAGRSVVLLERNAALAQEITARNSEVVHAGIYYPPGSLKALFCVTGRRALYQRCERLRIPHRRLGKLIVATNADERNLLEGLLERGRENDVEELRLLDGDQVSRRQPEIRAVAALESPATGIVDARALSLSYAAEAERHGAALVLHTEVREIEARSHGYRLTTRDAAGESGALDCGSVVNAAGLDSDAVLTRAGLDPDARGYRLRPCKGDYFALAPAARLRVTQLVYPVPDGPGLGVHLTLDLAGRVRFGPDAQYVDRRDYHVDPGKAVDFARAIARYLPGIRETWLSPDYAGIRPKLSGPGEPHRDFVVAEESEAGLPGFVNLVGIESPGLTASAAIADRVVELLAGL
ncbi:MAG TPA: NAD(P)/FAD-dependent oxidoreductase [Myxococcota bacterium]